MGKKAKLDSPRWNAGEKAWTGHGTHTNPISWMFRATRRSHDLESSDPIPELSGLEFEFVLDPG